MKKLLAFALSFLLVVGVLPLKALTAHAVIVDSGVCGAEGDGSNLIWTLDDAGMLTISGKGEMKDYNSDSPIWKGDSVKKLVILSGVTSIGTFAFDSCTGLTSVTIPDSMKSIKFDAFGGCSSLVSVTIPDGVTYLGGGVFEHCYSLESISIGKGITTIPNYAFRCCEKLTEVTIPNSVTNIDWLAFYGCKSLTHVVIPNTVTNIGTHAFGQCTNLIELTIPDSVTHLGDSVFYDTAWYDNQPDGIVYAGKVAYEYKGTMPENTMIQLKDGTRGIAPFSFAVKEQITSLIIPEGVICIGAEAFSSCKGITSVMIPNSVTEIERCAFVGCEALKSMIVPDSVVEIGINAIPENTVIYGYAGSYAQQWAKDNNRVFRLLEELVGDLNTDGKIGSDDARLALRASVGLEDLQPGTPAFIAADADKNEKLEPTDARLILRASVGLEQLA